MHMKLNLNSLLEMYGFPLPNSKSVKMVFHSTTTENIRERLRNRDDAIFDIYQRMQGWNVFHHCSHIISFIPERTVSSRAVFAGIFKVAQTSTPIECPLEARGTILESDWRPGNYWYDLHPTDDMAELKRRLVIHWGSSRSWNQWLTARQPKEVIEIRSKEYAGDFPGFDDVRIMYPELKAMINDPEGYRGWHNSLQSVAGIYLITDTKNGGLYVGSAHGGSGILGRWKSYATVWHGGNVQMQKAIKEKDIPYLQFSILHHCAKSKLKNEVLEYEKLYKNKLGKLACSLNDN